VHLVNLGIAVTRQPTLAGVVVVDGERVVQKLIAVTIQENGATLRGLPGVGDLGVWGGLQDPDL
jgi:hypothetical protein